MRLGILAFFILVTLPFVARAADLPVKVALSYETILGLPDDARCLDRVRDVFPNLIIENVPWKRIILNLEHGKTDLTPCLFQTPKRETFTDFFGPIAYLQIIMLFQNGQDLNLENISKLKGVFLRGTSLIKEYTTPDMATKEVNTINTVLQMIKLNRADYSLMPAHYINHRDTEGLTMKTVTQMPLYIGVSKKSPRNKEILQILSEKLPLKDTTRF
ncbi:MAG: transporter substrate-binding domain-containing protein [Methylocystaceae bacterium]|nr:transporter substrate-binding domain-containing protein [Methylocystaceae bacterium]